MRPQVNELRRRAWLLPLAAGLALIGLLWLLLGLAVYPGGEGWGYDYRAYLDAAVRLGESGSLYQTDDAQRSDTGRDRTASTCTHPRRVVDVAADDDGPEPSTHRRIALRICPRPPRSALRCCAMPVRVVRASRSSSVIAAFSFSVSRRTS